MAVVARALSDRRSDERRAHGCHSALLKAKCAILLLGLMVLGFIVFSMASMDQNAHSVDSNRPGGSDRSAGKTVAPAKPAFEKMFGHASFGGLPAAQNA